MVLKVGVDSLQKIESEFRKIIDSNVGRNEKFQKLFNLMAEGHAETQSIMRRGFVGLAIQNAELSAELRKEKRRNQKRLPKKEPITIKIYDSLIQSSQKIKNSNLY